MITPFGTGANKDSQAKPYVRVRSSQDSVQCSINEAYGAGFACPGKIHFKRQIQWFSGNLILTHELYIIMLPFCTGVRLIAICGDLTCARAQNWETPRTNVAQTVGDLFFQAAECRVYSVARKTAKPWKKVSGKKLPSGAPQLFSAPNLHSRQFRLFGARYR